MHRAHQLRDVAAAHRVAALLIVRADALDCQEMRDCRIAQPIHDVLAVRGVRHVLRLRRRRQRDQRHLLAQAAFAEPGFEGAHAKVVRHQRDRDAERRQGAGQEQGAERAIGLARGRRSRRNEKTRDHHQCRPRMFGEAATRGGEIIGAGVDQIALGILPQAALADVVLNDVAQFVEDGVVHRFASCRIGRKRSSHSSGSSAVRVIGS